MNITVEDVEREVRNIAMREPDFIYTAQDADSGSCGYVGKVFGSAEGRGCIIGQALQNLRVSKETLLDFEINSSASHIDSGVYNLLPYLKIGGYDDYSWLVEVQKYQDFGRPWGLAVELADDYVGGQN